MEMTLYILGAVCLFAPPFFAMLAIQGMYSLMQGKDFGHPYSFGFGIGMLSALPFLIIVLGIKADAFFPELGDTLGITVTAAIGAVLAVAGSVFWFMFLKREDAQLDVEAVENAHNMEYFTSCPLREWEVTNADPALRASLVQMNQYPDQIGSYGMHSGR